MHIHTKITTRHTTQIATRLLGAACPPLYWYVALRLLEEEREQQAPQGPRRDARGPGRFGFRRVFVAYCVLYNVLGPLLHCNFLPWT